MLSELKAEGRTIVRSTSDLEEAEAADEFFYLRRGRVIVSGGVQSLENSQGARLEEICYRREKRAQEEEGG